LVWQNEAELKFGLQRCQSNHPVFSYISARGNILLIVYVNDIMITGDYKKRTDDLKR